MNATLTTEMHSNIFRFCRLIKVFSILPGASFAPNPDYFDPEKDALEMGAAANGVNHLLWFARESARRNKTGVFGENRPRGVMSC